MPEPVILAVAPVPQAAMPGYDFSADAVADECVRCFEAGASLVHLHVRDQAGQPTDRLDGYDQIVRAIRRRTRMVIQGSTGGASALSLEQRCVSITHPLTQMGSLNLGSVNFGEGVYINTLPDIRYWAREMKSRDAVPELEVFDLSMVETGLMLAREGLIESPVFCLGLGFPSALMASEHTLALMAGEFGRVPAPWGLIHHGMRDMALLERALALGARMIRVGFEDSVFRADGTRAADNVALVQDAAALIRRVGFEPASPEQTMRMLGIRREMKAHE